MLIQFDAIAVQTKLGYVFVVIEREVCSAERTQNQSEFNSDWFTTYFRNNSSAEKIGNCKNLSWETLED